MRKMSQVFTRGVIRAFTSIQILVLCFGGTTSLHSANPPVPVLTLDAGGGVVAEFSDYGLNDYELVNGQYRGNFCFTLTNTSQRPSPALPIYLVGLGLINETGTPRFGIRAGYTAPANFIANLAGPETINDDMLIDAFLGARNFMAEELLDGPTDGLGAGESLSICIPLTNSLPFTLDELLTKFTVLFSDSIKGRYVSDHQPNRVSCSGIVATSFSDSEFGFYVENDSPSQAVTGFGFDMPNGSAYSLLAIDPTPQPGTQNFFFSTSAPALKVTGLGAVRQLEFGLLTASSINGGNSHNGIPGNASSSIFRIGGNFAGLTPRDFLTGALVRIPGGWETLRNDCPHTEPSGSGVRGAVATNPR